MKKLSALFVPAALALPAAAIAHPVGSSYDTRGQCESVLNQANKIDRDLFGFLAPNNGAAEVGMLDAFSCEYDPTDGKWYLVGFPDNTGNLGNGNGKADPGTPQD